MKDSTQTLPGLAYTRSATLNNTLFHAVFWTIWFILPLVDKSFHIERDMKLIKVILPLAASNVPLFFINSEFLIPRILMRRGVYEYTMALIALILVIVVLKDLLRDRLVAWQGLEIQQRAYFSFFNILPTAFIAAVSTGYGLVRAITAKYMQQQQQLQERLQTELSFLRSQISPHFIFNVLNSLVYLIRSNKKAAEQVTIQLSEMMRYMLYQSDDSLVPLEKELEYVENYIDLQRIRFEEDVKINYTNHCQIGGQLIEPMLLIPFVENAFKHGVGLLTDPVIDVAVACNGGQLRFTVKNKMAPEPPEVKDKSSGIGLKNVSRRLELLYPGSHTLTCRPQENWFVSELILTLKNT